MEDLLSGTKEVIFDAAIQLISTYGFETITMRDIASAVGIKASSIYYYYPSKNQILDSIYEYFLAHVFFSKKPIDELKKLIETCTPKELVYAIHAAYDYSKEGEKNQNRLVFITKIIYMRIFTDTKANEIFFDILSNDGIEYTRQIIEYGIKIGRIEPVDATTFSTCLNGQLTINGIKSFADISLNAHYMGEEDKIKNLFAGMLHFK